MTDRTLLPQVSKPGRYIGSEFNMTRKDWQAALVRCALIFPDLYEIGMSHQGLQILYHILNATENVLAERCYCPDVDAEQLLREQHKPLTSLESAHPLNEFDILAITLPYELCYGNILTILERAGLPFFAKDRQDTFPLLLGGGACSMNPEPVADFFDAILLGDGEEAVIEITAAVAESKKGGLTKPALLDLLAQIAGVYIPSHFSVEYDSHGHITTMRHLKEGRPHVMRRVLPDLDAIDHLLHPIVPNAKIVHDRLGVEIARGCTRGCRFCQAGITYRPVRERSPEQIMTLAREGIANSGFEELALLSLSTGDYSCLGDVLPMLMDTFADEYVSVAMPSMRVGTLTPAIMDQIKRVRKTGFTLAPEAGSERLRRVINKGITEADLLATCRAAYALGWKVMKLYFMIGLPTETEQDIDEIVELVKKTKQESNAGARGKKQINVSIGTFVPKPHTPFQWQRQLSLEESRDRINHLKHAMPRKGCNLKWHSPKQSFLEGVFSRGDRRLARLIQAAWQLGARLDGWSDHFNLDAWQTAAQECELDLQDYLRARTMDEILPWQHLQTGVDLEFLQQEYTNCLNETYTPDCRYHGCQQCGLCDFETIRPIVYGSEEHDVKHQGDRQQDKRATPAHEEKHFKYLVRYTRTDNIAFLGHLEILQLIFRALRRANITTNFSKGFHPSPKVSFGPALPVGTESMAEYFIMDLPELLSDPSGAATLLSSTLPTGIEITDISLHSGKIPQNIASTYILQLNRAITAEERQKVEAFLAAQQWLVSRIRKGKKKEVNIRPLITTCEITGDTALSLVIESRSGAPGIKPTEAAMQILGIDEQTALSASVMKTAWHQVEESKSR